MGCSRSARGTPETDFAGLHNYGRLLHVSPAEGHYTNIGQFFFLEKDSRLPFSVRVAEVMDRNVVLIDSEGKVMDAIDSMVEHDVWSLVVTRQGMPLGVVTDSDILRRCLSKGKDARELEAKQIMSLPLITVRADATLGAMNDMVTREVRRPYIVENDEVIGRITQTLLLGNILGLVEMLSTVTS